MEKIMIEFKIQLPLINKELHRGQARFGKIMFNYYADENIGFNDCAIEGNCSIDPVMYSLMEILLYELKQITYYVVKMLELGYDNPALKSKIIRYLSIIIVGYEFNRQEFEQLLREINREKKEVERVFMEVCEKRNIDCQILHSHLKIENFDFISMINQGERQAVLRNKAMSTNVKNLTEIILQLIKSAAVRLVELENYKSDCNQETNAILKLFNSLNFSTFNEAKLTRKINDFAKANFDIHRKLHSAKEEYYGNIRPVEISTEIKKGPAILVTGQNLYDFERLLEATKNEDINIYTHDGMIVAHAYPKFAQYHNLVGHFQKSLDNFQMDFSLFKGAIVITQNAQHKFERLFRGRIFTTNPISGKGMRKIVNDDFSPVIQAAIDAKGFDDEVKSPPVLVGYDEQKIMEKVDKIIEKIKNGEIKHLFIVGLINHSLFAQDYFNELVANVPETSYVLSTAVSSDRENVFHIDSYFNTSLIYKILEKLKENIDLSKFPVSMFMTQCNLHTISHLFNLKLIGIRDIYLPECSANILTPNMINFLRDKFGFRQISDNAKKDLKKICS